MTRWGGWARPWGAEPIRRALPGGFELDDDPARVDVDAVHAFISQCSYWGGGRRRDVTVSAIGGSARVVGLYHHGEQVGFARAISIGPRSRTSPTCTCCPPTAAAAWASS